MSITAPYNFVPLNEEVFFPDWVEDVSHDIPFSDGESGEIDITIEAKSPVFIRNHTKDKENPSTEFCHFVNADGAKQYYIPSSSIKGMVRNVLEILSFSKMSFIDDNTYAVRDLSSAKNFYMKQMNLIDEPFTQCGWLKIVDDKYVIEDCGTPGRINHTQIDCALGMEFAKHFKSNEFNDKDNNQKTSQYKYKLVGNKIHTITVGDMYRSEANAKYDKREFYKYDKNGKNKASLILTGQPTLRKNTGKMGDGKGFEFLFFDAKEELIVDEKVVENFKFAYFDGRKTEPKESPDWAFWKDKLKNGEKIPVFFQKDGKKVLHFGLSYLYKLPYKYSIKEGLPKAHMDDRPDMAQTIFGYIDKANNKALKGRAWFSHFKVINEAQPLPKRTEILGTPRASYYPIYIRQYNTEFKTYMDGDFAIAGRKRYPIHKGNKATKTEDTGNENVGTTFTPLKDGVTFKGKLRYHNLKKCEIGAILSALTFHDTPETYHNVGLAKSLGYGKISVKLDEIEDITPYLKEFEMYLSEQIDNWSNSEQLKELLAMAVEQDNNENSKLAYMTLTDFAKSKSKDKDYLRRYTQLDGIKSIVIKSLISQSDMQELEKRKQENQKEQEQFEKERRLKQEHDNDYKVIKSTTNIAQIESFISKYPDSKHVDEAKKLIAALKQKELEEKENKAKEEVRKAFENLDKTNAKHVEAFIKKWQNIDYAQEFINKLQMQNKNLSSVISLEELNTVDNAKRFKKILEENQEKLKGSEKLIKSNAIRVYHSLKGKQKKNFFQDIQLARFLGKEFEEYVKGEM